MQKLRSLFTRKNESFSATDIAVLVASLSLFAVIALGNITRWSIWFDEAFGIYMIRFNYFDIASYTASDVHPPFYYWVLKAWTSIFGTSELAVRSLSLFAMMGALVFVYLILRRAFSLKVATGGLIAMALSPLLIRYAEEARMYGMVALIVAAATYTFLQLLEKPSRKKWIIYGILVSLGMWTHYFTALMWLAHWVYRFFAVRRRSMSETLRVFFSKEWIRAHILAVGLFLPWLPFMAKQLTNVQGGGFWIPPVSLATMPNFAADIFFYRSADDAKSWLAVLLWGVVLGTVLLAAACLRRITKEQRRVVGLLVAMVIVPIVLLILLSMPPLRPAFIDRYLISSVLSLFALIGVVLALGVASPSTRRYATILSVALAGVLAIGITHVYATGNYNTTTNDPLPIRQTLRMAQEKASPGEPFVSESIWRFYESHYYQTDRNQVYLQAEDSLVWGSYDMVRHNPYHKVYDVAAFARQHGGKIWFIGDWKADSPKLPRTGKWTVVQEVHVDGISDDISTIRAVELEVKS